LQVLQRPVVQPKPCVQLTVCSWPLTQVCAWLPLLMHWPPPEKGLTWQPPGATQLSLVQGLLSLQVGAGLPEHWLF
jgi:hypothetical protein